MAWTTANTQNVRTEVLRRLYTHRDNILGTGSSGGTVSLIEDTGTTDTVTLESAVYSNNDFIGAWAYVPSVAAPKVSRVTAYDRDAGTLTLSPALGATAASVAYEIHWLMPPDRLNDWITYRAREASSGAITTIAEATAVNISKFTLAEGVLADALRYLAKRESGPGRQLLEQEADHHEMLWLERLALEGLNPLVNRLNVKREQTEAAQILRRF